ncbi:hypothetical protein N7499_004046 [Penicillium canescens]|nr:hypothetical protein N7522_011839 [Penicillium canescens]KAJ6089199.1 hypothetical protein N7499_004046 [Penicillium canescens]KAJ6181518.1 hypothetical protein N7485_000160 [Penicillium canescens]
MPLLDPREGQHIKWTEREKQRMKEITEVMKKELESFAERTQRGLGERTVDEELPTTSSKAKKLLVSSLTHTYPRAEAGSRQISTLGYLSIPGWYTDSEGQAVTPDRERQVIINSNICHQILEEFHALRLSLMTGQNPSSDGAEEPPPPADSPARLQRMVIDLIESSKAESEDDDSTN